MITATRLLRTDTEKTAGTDEFLAATDLKGITFTSLEITTLPRLQMSAISCYVCISNRFFVDWTAKVKVLSNSELV